MDRIWLQGSEDVTSAGNNMRRAAEEMQQAARNISGALEQHQLFMNDWLDRFSATLREADNGK